MTRLNLADIPAHLLTGAPAPQAEPDPARVERVARLRGLRAGLSRCAGRMTCTPASISGEIERIEAIVAGLRVLAVELGSEKEG